MRAFDLLSILKEIQIFGTHNAEVSAVTSDSRAIIKDALFVAVRGVHTDGHVFIENAIAKGAITIVCENLPEKLSDSVLYAQVKNSAEALGLLSAQFYDNPSEKFTLIGVTGTNGKTTCVTLLFDLFTALGYKCGLVSTVENRIGKEIIPATHTTPDAPALQKLFKQMCNSGCSHVFMEVSSHALEQHRVTGAQFAGAVFTNLTHDHLDYHGTFDNYLRAKRRLFDGLSKSAFAITNNDDKNGHIMLQNTRAHRMSYALKKLATYRAKIFENSIAGLHLQLDGFDFHARMIGTFNAYNLLAVYSVARTLGFDSEIILEKLSNLRGAEGRFDYIVQPEKNIVGIVDYAHTPDALEKILETLQQLRKPTQQIITVTGAGGDRDATKRPIMARIAATLSDRLILTSDNPRSEKPETIIKQMRVGVSLSDTKKVLCITDRREAIKTAVALAQKNDIILIAGKGHEKYQDVNGVKSHFDDKEELRAAFS